MQGHSLFLLNLLFLMLFPQTLMEGGLVPVECEGRYMTQNCGNHFVVDNMFVFLNGDAI